MAIETGAKFAKEMTVEEQHTVSPAGRTEIQVFSTPAMIMLMELTCNESLQGFLDDGYASVGIHVDVYHNAMTPIESVVRAESEIIAVDGKKVKFRVKAFDESGEIGTGTHERAVINLKRMLGED